MWTRVVFVLALAAFLAIVTAIGCGGGDLLIGSSVPPPIPTGAPTATCGQSGDACSFGSDCCSGTCDPIVFECT